MGLFSWTPEEVAALKARAEKAEAELATFNNGEDSLREVLSNTRMRLDQAERLLEAAKIARTPDGIKALADSVAREVDDTYARGGDNVAGRLRNVSAQVADALKVALTGGDKEFY